MSPQSCVRPTGPPRDDGTGSIDLPTAARAANAFLAALGLPDDAAERGDAGWCLARTYATVLAIEPPPPTTERIDADGGDLVVVPAIMLGTLCPDHLLPITALARVGYLPDRLVAPTPVIADAMRYLAAPPQPVSGLAGRLADWLHAATQPHGVGVTVQVEHTCPLPPSPSAADVTGVGTALRGRVRDDPPSAPNSCPSPTRPPPSAAPVRKEATVTDPLTALTDAGVSIWLDDLSREQLTSGSLARLVADQHVAGVTTNPTIFAKAITGSDTYTEQLGQLAARRVEMDTALREITTFDVRWAADVLRPMYDASDGVDGRVSIEVDPRIAHDTERTIAEAKALWWLVDRPNLFVKIPAAKQGLPAISACLAEGISINVTLIFSLARYSEVIDAFLTGLEQARVNGHDLATISSVASFFVSRVDTEIDHRLDKLGSDTATALRGKAAIANARLAYQRYEQACATDRWRALQQAGARPQRPLWASTGVKDPAYPDTRYVVDLVAPEVVNTMPEATLRAVADHGVIPADSVHGTYEAAQQILDDLAELGIDYDDVVRVLEEEGVAKFDASWDHLGEQLTRTLSTTPATSGR